MDSGWSDLLSSYTLWNDQHSDRLEYFQDLQYRKYRFSVHPNLKRLSGYLPRAPDLYTSALIPASLFCTFHDFHSHQRSEQYELIHQATRELHLQDKLRQNNPRPVRWDQHFPFWGFQAVKDARFHANHLKSNSKMVKRFGNLIRFNRIATDLQWKMPLCILLCTNQIFQSCFKFCHETILSFLIKRSIFVIVSLLFGIFKKSRSGTQCSGKHF